MEDLNVTDAEVQTQNDELEPQELAPISEVTGASAGGGGDERGQIIWGEI